MKTGSDYYFDPMGKALWTATGRQALQDLALPDYTARKDGMSFCSVSARLWPQLTNEFGLRWSNERGHLLLGEELLSERVDLVCADAFIEGFSDRQV